MNATTKTITRKINGKETKLTPVQNFIRQTSYRMTQIRAQLAQLSKQHGVNYEYTTEFVDNIEMELTGLIETYLGVLRDPKSANTDGYTFDCSK